MEQTEQVVLLGGEVELGGRVELGADSEFVAPQASCRVVLAQASHESNADLDEERITCRMTEGVVHVLEVVDVEDHRRRPAAVAVDARDRQIDYRCGITADQQ